MTEIEGKGQPEKLHIQLLHFKQKYNWDCGISCVLMVLPRKHRQHLLKNFAKVCKEEGFYGSTWTIDLCYLLKRYGVNHIYYTVTLGVHPGYKGNSFYHNILTKPMSYHLEKQARIEGGSANDVQRKSTSPKKICNLSTQSFSEIVDYAAFVDKTLFIKAFLETCDSVIVALAPRRFGKSTNMNMMKEFLTGNKKLFQDNQLKIWKEEKDFFDKYCEENPVIYVDFKNITGRTTDEFLQSLKHRIYLAFKEHRYLINKIDGKYSWSDTKLEEVLGSIEIFENYWNNYKNLDENEVINGLKLLSHCLHVYHNKPVYVLIDEFDFPIMNIIVKQSTSKNEVLDETIELIGRIMSITLKNNEHVKKGLINACVRVAEVLTGDANNIQYYQFLRKPIFAPYFGFTNIEVKSLLEKAEICSF